MTTFLTKLRTGKPRRIHASNGQRPLCGGGNGGRATHWQEDMAGPCNCAACAKVALGQNSQISSTPPPSEIHQQLKGQTQ